MKSKVRKTSYAECPTILLCPECHGEVRLPENLLETFFCEVCDIGFELTFPQVGDPLVLH